MEVQHTQAAIQAAYQVMLATTAIAHTASMIAEYHQEAIMRVKNEAITAAECQVYRVVELQAHTKVDMRAVTVVYLEVNMVAQRRAATKVELRFITQRELGAVTEIGWEAGGEDQNLMERDLDVPPLSTTAEGLL